MTKTVGVTIVFVFLVMAACIVWILHANTRTSVSAPDGDGPAGIQDAGLKENVDAQMIGAHLVGLVDSPLMESTEGRELYKGISEGQLVREHRNGVYIHICGYKNMKRNVPMVELRFKKKDRNGELRPAIGLAVYFRRRIGRQTTSVESVCQFRGGAEVKGARLQTIAGPPTIKGRYLIFGHRYLVRCIDYDHRRPNSGDPMEYASIVKIPDSILPGKMAVIDVMLKYEPDTLDQMGTEDPIAGRITVPLPHTDRKWLVAYTHPDDSQNRWTEVGENGSFEIGEKQLGGMLRVAEKGGAGVAWMWVRSVQKRQLSLPRDADRHIPRDKLKDVKLAIPQSRINDAFVGLWLKTKKDDTGPIVWKAFRSDSNAFKKFKSTGIVDLEAPPGRYWVSVFYDPGTPDKRRWVPLGRVTIPQGEPQGPIQIKAEK